MSLESCSVYFRKPAPFEEGKEYYSTGTKRDPNEKSTQVLLAFDPRTRNLSGVIRRRVMLMAMAAS